MSTTRRRFVAASAAAPLAAQRAERPNILYIMTDQQHSGMMSCTGNPWVKTPAMDSIAASGVRFELAYASNPVCVPARTSMVTGRYPSHFGIRGNAVPNFPGSAMAQGLGNLVRSAGYRTVFGGKTHWPKPMNPEGLGFEYITDDERDELATRCADFLRGPQDKPFFLVASFINPHDICYMAIDAYTKAQNVPPMYPKSVVERQCMADALQIPTGAKLPPIPRNLQPTTGEAAALDKYPGFRGWARKNWTEEDWRRHRWAYCRLTERVDAEIGRVLSALRETGLDRNTVIIFTSDHGDMDSAHRFEHKSLPYEESARVPFIITQPGRTARGRVDRRHLLSTSIDLMPTVCDYAGVTPPAGLPGRSIRPIAEGRSVPWRDDVVIECVDSRSVRSARYKYCLFDGAEPREMLFDLERDPGETTNLATAPKHSADLAAHRARLRAGIESRHDEFGRSLLAKLPA